MTIGGHVRRHALIRRILMAAAAVAATLLVAAGGGSPASAAPRAGAAMSGYLYWSNATASDPGKGTIGRARLNGTDLNQKFITGASVPGVVLVFGGYLYWANLAPLNDGAGTIGRARLNGTDVNQKFIKTAQPNGPDDVVADSGHLYWANDFNIGRANLNGTDVIQNFIAVPNGPSGVSALAANARYIYWTDETAGTIGRARLNGTDVNQKFITGAAFPQTGLAIDSRYIYWINETGGTIGRARLNGTDVNQKFIKVPGADILLGVAVDPGQRGRARNHSSLSTGSGPTLARTGGGPATGA